MEGTTIGPYRVVARATRQYEPFLNGLSAEGVAERYFAYPHWTADSQSLLAEHADAIVRINVESGAREEVVPIDALRRVNGMFGEWLGFAPDSSPLVLRDTSIQEIFALEVEERD